MHRGHVTWLPAAVAVLALAACGAPAGRQLAAQTPSGPSTVLSTSSASPAPVMAADPLPAIKTIAGDITSVRMTLNVLRRAERDTLTLIFTLTNEGAEVVHYSVFFAEDEFSSPGDAQSHDVSGAYLVDTKNRRKHQVLRDTDRACLCSAGLITTSLEPGGEAVLFAKFTAPPADVTTLSVVVPHFPVIEGVPISS
jgi:hypothetical protein